MRKRFHKRVATSWPFSRLLLKKTSFILASQMSTDQAGRGCVEPTFHGLRKAQLCRRKSKWFSVEIKNYDILPRLATFGLSSLGMFMTFHSMGDIAHFMTNTSLYRNKSIYKRNSNKNDKPIPDSQFDIYLMKNSSKQHKN